MTWLRAFGRFFDQKIGLHRLGVILSLIIITVAAVVLYRKLHNINVSKVRPRWRRSNTGRRDFRAVRRPGYFT
jgi:uncharacterized BrkB/YihY/UPF0761 family membrane protein